MRFNPCPIAYIINVVLLDYAVNVVYAISSVSSDFVFLQPTVKLGGSPIRLKQCGPRLRGSQRRADDKAVRGPNPLPRQPRGKFAHKSPIFLVKPELNLFSFSASRRLGNRFRFFAAWFRLFDRYGSR